ncbi:MAG TPA: hypothetical protein VNH19_10290 [Candidatus Limnocylindrales bacterium]|nr:hypothetical protein [Candidatus Limnocylindrales bacterium]
MNTNTQLGHLVALFFLAIGVAGLGFPYRIQAAALRKRANFWGFQNPFLGWMETQGYIWMLRAIGVVAFGAALFIELVILCNR